MKSGDIKLNIFESLWIVTLTNMGRYIPGGLWNHLGIIHMIKRKNKLVSIKKITYFQLINLLYQLIDGFFFIVFFIPVIAKIAVIFMYCIYFLFDQIIVRKTLFFIAKKFNKSIKVSTISLKTRFQIHFFSFLFWICLGSSFYYLGVGVGLTAHNLFLMTITLAAFSFSWVVGFLILPLPSGAGARELTISFLLSSSGLPSAISFTYSLIFRFLLLIRDLLLLILMKSLIQIKKRV